MGCLTGCAKIVLVLVVVAVGAALFNQSGLSGEEAAYWAFFGVVAFFAGGLILGRR